MILPGRLRDRVWVQKPTRETNSLGETVLSWENTHRIWCNIEGVKSSEVLTNSRQEFDISHRVHMRYQKGLTNNHRLEYNGRKLEIISLLEHDNRTRHEAICRENVPQ